MANLPFNAKDVPADDFEPVPDNTYSAQIVRSEMKETKAKTGQYLQLNVQILDEPFTGRLIFERLNLINQNEVAVKIANRTLADIVVACGLEEIEDSEELHGVEFKIKVVTEEGSGDFPPQNVIKKYMAA
jgi:hypothetical protein